MTQRNESGATDDSHNLSHFLEAQEEDYELAIAEIRAGRKQSHWMWYIFPQFEGLGQSATTRRYSIKSIAEAEAYLRHPILGPRLTECAAAVLSSEGKTAREIFGSPDDIKLKSCATLFSLVTPAGSPFDQLLDQYYQGERDGETLLLTGLLK